MSEDTHTHAGAPCPACGHWLNRSAGITGPSRGPEPGDLTVCLGCGQALVFGAGLSLTVLTNAQAKRMTPEQARIVREVQAFIRQRKGSN